MKVRPINQHLSNNKVLDLKKSTPTKQVIDNHLDLSLQHLTRWMGLLGIAPPSSFNPRFNCFLRFFSFLLVVSIHIWLVVHISLNARNVSVSYVRQISTTTTSWTFIIDNLNLAMYVVGGHVFLLFLTRPKTWKEFTVSFKLLEDNLSTRNIYLRCRRQTVNAIIYISVSVK